MKRHVSLLCSAALFLGAACFSVEAQLTLSGTNYNQNFDTISKGVPPGWSLRTNATTTTLGTVSTNYNAGGKSWSSTAGEYGNCAATVSDSGTNFIGNESSTIQGNGTNRALALRQTSSFGDPGAAFTLQISDTRGASNLTLKVDLCILRTNSNITTWTIQYALGDSPDSFTTLGTYTNATGFGAATRIYNLGPDADDVASNLWIRVVALSAASGGGSRATFGLDNFSLSWNGNIGSAPGLFISRLAISDRKAQIDFTGDAGDGPEAFILQSADQVSGPYTDAGAEAIITQVGPGAFHAAAPLTASQQFYRIKRP